jgi:hypothetical protein
MMFLAAVAQSSPRHGFDGRIAMIRVCEEQVAKEKVRIMKLVMSVFTIAQ